MVAGAAERLRLVTYVLELPYRKPVLTAKMAASLDVLSGGRLTLGIGAGWLSSARILSQHDDRQGSHGASRHWRRPRCMRYAVDQARRGWLEAGDVLNTRDLHGLKAAIRHP